MILLSINLYSSFSPQKLLFHHHKVLQHSGLSTFLHDIRSALLPLSQPLLFTKSILVNLDPLVSYSSPPPSTPPITVFPHQASPTPLLTDVGYPPIFLHFYNLFPTSFFSYPYPSALIPFTLQFPLNVAPVPFHFRPSFHPSLPITRFLPPLRFLYLAAYTSTSRHPYKRNLVYVNRIFRLNSRNQQLYHFMRH